MFNPKIEAEIDADMRLGRMYDAKSDRAYARGDITFGEHWGRLAIAAYTRAENLSRYMENID